ncbi:MAG: AAA family ATPase [Chloroflexota bacterium]
MPFMQEPFLDNDNGWEIRDDQYALLRIADGDYAYVFEHRREQGEWTTWQPLQIPDDVEYQIHTVIERVSGPNNGYGLLWGCQDEENCASFEIARSGHYRIRQRTAGNWSEIRPWTASRHIRPGEHALNELLIIQLADKARFFINEQFVMELSQMQRPLGHGFGFVVNGRIRIRIHSAIVLHHVQWPPDGRTPSLASVNTANIEPVLDELSGLIGLNNIKQEVRTFINFLKVQKMRQERGMSAASLSYHMVLTGPPGTGKTTVARLIGRVYRELGILQEGHLVETDRAGLVAPYVGQTALRVNELVERALGGILFIDEAYALMPRTNHNGHDFGLEAIETLLKRMEDHRGRFAVIIAGYADEMERFLGANPGVRSRFNRYFTFNHYKPQELVMIFKGMAREAGLCLSPEAEAALQAHFAQVCQERDGSFGNGRYARNLLEKVMERQANRIVNLTSITDDVLITLAAVDIPDVGLYTIH